MKRLLPIILCLCLLFSGCGRMADCPEGAHEAIDTYVTELKNMEGMRTCRLYSIEQEHDSLYKFRYKEYLDYAMSRRDKLVLQILRHGAEEGTIRMDFSQEYIVMAIMANLSCLNSCLHLPKAAEYIRQIEQKKDIAYTLLLKSLN